MIGYLKRFNRQQILTAVALVGLFILAWVPRAVRSDLMEFKHDEAVAWIRSAAMVEGIEFPCTGLVSSQGLENFPLFLYLCAAFQVLFNQPHQLIQPIALLNSLAIFFIFGSVQRLINRRVAWLTCLLYAISPCAIFFSRKIWAQDFMPFWSATLFYFGTVLLTDKKERHLAWIPFCFAFLAVTSIQIHFSALFLLIGYLVALFATRRDILKSPISLTAGAITGLLPAIPYFYHLIFQAGLTSTPLFQKLGASMHFRPKELLVYFVRQPADEGFHGYLGPDYLPYLASIPGYQIVRYSLSLAVVIGIVICLYRLLRSKTEEQVKYKFCFILTLVPLLLMGLARIPLVPSYFIIFYPLPFFLVALTLDWLWVGLAKLKTDKLIICVCLILMMFFCIYQLCYVGNFMHKMDVEGGTQGEYGITYSEIQEAGHWLATYGFSSDELEFVDLYFLPSCMLFSDNRASLSDKSDYFDLDMNNKRVLLVNRLLYPHTDPEQETWIVNKTTALCYLIGPSETIERIQKEYSNQNLTPLQASEEDRIRRLAFNLMKHTD